MLPTRLCKAPLPNFPWSKQCIKFPHISFSYGGDQEALMVFLEPCERAMGTG